MLNLTLRQLDYVTAIARHGGLSAAARAVHVSQPALSVALAQVEAALGQPLFHRRPKGLTPTAFGTAWMAEAEVQLAALGRLMQARVQPPLRIGLFEDLAPAVLAPLLVWARAESLEIAARPLGFAALSEGLEQGRIDLALSWALGLRLGPSVEIARIAPCALVPPAHPWAGQGVTLARLAQEPLVLTDQDLSVAHVQSLFHARGLAPRIAHRCASLELMRSFAANGLGIGLSWTQPLSAFSHDGLPLALCPILDAPAEPILLAGPAPEALVRFLQGHLARWGGLR